MIIGTRVTVGSGRRRPGSGRWSKSATMFNWRRSAGRRGSTRGGSMSISRLAWEALLLAPTFASCRLFRGDRVDDCGIATETLNPRRSRIGGQRPAWRRRSRGRKRSRPCRTRRWIGRSPRRSTQNWLRSGGLDHMVGFKDRGDGLRRSSPRRWTDRTTEIRCHG